MEHDVKARLGSALHAGEAEDAAEATRALLEAGESVDTILAVLRHTMDEVGEKYRIGEYFIPELVLSGKAAEAAINILLPHLTSAGDRFLGTVVLGTVAGDIHDLGKTIVFTMLSAAGFRVYDLGVDVPAVRFVEKTKEVNASIVGASALMSTTVNRMRDITAAFEQAGMRKDVKIMVGGAAVTPEFARMIGADGYGKDAHEAVVLAKSLVR
ncbi:MAG: Methyltransferase corrinoid protein [candidate division NC10 bacterium]|nr:Methyltransferase corrinoid protein [candidate division NC10 bacterium]